ncbi:class D beta-lactamase [Duganella sp. SAP-35]|uniref:Class D beta-lactamase n=2 Tax=Duganella aceris TaxID=2703883 RepID=A0ABX0FMU7_9BURK|nr:class D beta-lactamase [Duganella aceris]NGZ85946.1 class D beta-lactamase [Duganella aceris]
MSPTDLLLLRFLLACVGCVAAGLGVWSVMLLCRRCLPGVCSQRTPWLLAQCTIVAAFLLILLPHSERLRLLPPIEMDGGVSTHAVAPGQTAAPAAVATATDAPAKATAARPWLAVGAQAWLIVYLLGLGHSSLKLMLARRVLRGLAAAGGRLSAQDRHPGFADAPAPDAEVIEVDAPISPMLFGLLHPRLLLPAHLRGFDIAQQQMIVAHELTHLRRHDLHWAGAGVLLQTLFWFNPIMRLLRARLSWAQELGCDREVLSGRPAAQRKAYAAALVAQLRLRPCPDLGALAFGGASASTLAGRISLIREPGATARGPWTRLAAIGALAGVLGASLALQPALAWRADQIPATQPATQPTAQVDHAAAHAAPSAQAMASCTTMSDAASGKRLVHDGQCDDRVTPASTFNLAVSLMGYDSGILQDEHAPLLPFQAGYIDWNPEWRAATDPSSWLKYSVVWYAQQVTAKLGAARFQDYIQRFGYGNRDVSGDPGKDNGLSMSWISSSLKISPAEQVTFLRGVVNRQLGLSPRAYDMTIRIMPTETLANGWRVHGKTGTAAPVLADGHDDPQHQYGWYVGWASKGQRTIVFARMVLDRRQEGFAGGRVKEAFLLDLTARLDSL